MTREVLYGRDKAREVLGFTPRVALADGLRTAVDWLRGTGES